MIKKSTFPPQTLITQEGRKGCLRQAIGEADKGDDYELQQIMHEVTSKTPRKDVFEGWMKAIIEIVNEPSARLKSSENLLTEIVLKRVPWFEWGSTANKSFHLLEKYVLKLLSSNPQAFLPIVHRILFSRILSLGEAQKSTLTRPEIRIAGEKFHERGSLLGRIHAILHEEKYVLSNEYQKVKLDEADFAFMMEYFQHHPRSASKLKDVESIRIGFSEKVKDQRVRCFYLQNSNGKLDFISYLKPAELCFAGTVEYDSFAKLSSYEKQMCDQLISLMKKLITLYPLSQSYLLSYVDEALPSRSELPGFQCLFFTLCLKLASAIEKLEAPLFGRLVRHLLALESELKRVKKRVDQNEEEGRILYKIESGAALDLYDNLLSLLFRYMQHRLCVIEDPLFKGSSEGADREGIIYVLFDTFLELARCEPTKLLQNIFIYLCSLYTAFPMLIEKFLSLLLLKLFAENASKLEQFNSLRNLFLIINTKNNLPISQLSSILKSITQYIESILKQYKLNERDRKEQTLQLSIIGWTNLVNTMLQFNEESHLIGAEKMKRKIGKLAWSIKNLFNVNTFKLLSIETLLLLNRSKVYNTAEAESLMKEALSSEKIESEEGRTLTVSCESFLVEMVDVPALTANTLKKVGFSLYPCCVAETDHSSTKRTNEEDNHFLSPSSRLAMCDDTYARSIPETDETDVRRSYTKKEEFTFAKQVRRFEEAPRKLRKYA